MFIFRFRWIHLIHLYSLISFVLHLHILRLFSTFLIHLVHLYFFPPRPILDHFTWLHFGEHGHKQEPSQSNILVCENYMSWKYIKRIFKTYCCTQKCEYWSTIKLITNYINMILFSQYWVDFMQWVEVWRKHWWEQELIFWVQQSV